MIEKIFTFAVVFGPVIDSYSFMGTRLSIFNVILICLIPIFILARRKVSLGMEFLPLFSMIIINTIWVLAIGAVNDTEQLLGTVGRYLFYIFFLLIFSKEFYLKEFGKRMIINMSCVLTIYLLVQVLCANIFGILLPGGIPFIPLENFREDVTAYVDSVAEYGLRYRPRSFLSEPAHYGQYVLLGLSLLFTSENINSKERIIKISLLIIGIAFSRSLLALSGLVFVLFYYFITNKSKDGINLKMYKLIGGGAGIVLSLIFLLSFTTIGDELVNRIINSGGVLNTGRFVALTDYFSAMNDLTYWVWGHGLVKADFFMPSYNLWIYAFGGLGFTVLVFVLLIIYRRGDVEQKSAIALLLFLGFGSELFLGGYFFFYMNFLISRNRMSNDVMMSK